MANELEFAKGRQVGPPVSTIDILAEAVQELSLVNEMSELQALVARSARELTGADGATFVLREGSESFYAAEDAIAPLWKGSRFPVAECPCGWTLNNRQPLVVTDVYADHRLPPDPFRRTFVESLAIVPIRSMAPIGAIGCYWSDTHTPDSLELAALQALADASALALEQVYTSESALTDPQSDLSNRRGFFSGAGALLVSNRDRSLDTIVVFGDLGDLRPLNGRFGHEAGDRALRGAGESLRQILGEDAVVGRLGGGNFVACATSNSFPIPTAEDLEDSIRATVGEAEEQLELTIGVALGPPDDKPNIDSLVAQSHERMHERKYCDAPLGGARR
jgi:diguanylate cyclase (GGDEF)-like protein